MRHEHETATSFNQLKEITQIMQVQKRSVQNSANANASEIKYQSTLTPKIEARAKKGALKPTKRAFSERQMIAIRDNSQTSDNNKAITQTLLKAMKPKKGGNNES
ncbi:hypothetical protein [Helicobacter pylori]|uniref:hypothetical protein n=1 Tax=Helicobacter pylori TaxID=210 RepID=UPI000D371735|nr:hypothetical protein [Helicobacter pylori]PUD09724.1 hypothetical protein C2R86_07425 [Helicobacter pylori]